MNISIDRYCIAFARLRALGDLLLAKSGEITKTERKASLADCKNDTGILTNWRNLCNVASHFIKLVVTTPGKTPVDFLLVHPRVKGHINLNGSKVKFF